MLSDKQKSQLKDVAKQSIEHGLNTGKPLAVNINEYDEGLRKICATFVTLNIGSQLRGCIGTLKAIRPLIEDVSHNAYAAAFQDNRFNPLSAQELGVIKIHISILNEPEDIYFSSESGLIDSIRPGIDGLILKEGYKRATFLPSVWQSLPDKHDFLNHLKSKAGLDKNYWSKTIEIQRYTVEEF